MWLLGSTPLNREISENWVFYAAQAPHKTPNFRIKHGLVHSYPVADNL
jgi:hypothetical protein